MRALRGANAPAVLATLNPIMRGWAAYYRGVVSSKVFTSAGRLPVEAHLQVGQHAATRTSRSPGSSTGTSAQFNKSRNDRWVFGDRDSGAYLPKFAWTNIVRHAMVKGTASPDDPALAEYWAERRATDQTPAGPLHPAPAHQAGRRAARSAGNYLLTADQPPQSPEQWERWWLQVTRKAIAASYLIHHGGPGSPDGKQTRLVHASLPSRADSPPAQGTSTANLHAPAACLSRMPR